MPNIDEKYTLTEIAKELNVVPTFINRIQKETGIGGPIGTKGKAASFEKKYVRIFRMVKALRLIGLNFEDIKQLWVLEEAILKIQDKLRKGEISRLPVSVDEPGSQSIRLILHKDSVYYSKTMDDLKIRDPYKKSYPELLEMLINRKQEIGRRRGIITEELNKIDAELDDVLSAENHAE